MSEPAALRQLCESYCDMRWHFDPVEGSGAGVAAHDPRLGSFTDERVREYVAALRSLASAVEALDVEVLDDEIDRTALLNHMRVEEHRWRQERPHQRDAGTWVQQILEGLHQLLLVRDRDHRDLALAARSRLEAVPGLLAAAQATLRECPYVLLDAALEGLEAGTGLIADTQDAFRADAGDGLESSGAIARDAIAAFTAHLKGLRSAVDPDFPIGIGRDALTFRLRFQHAIAASSEELLRFAAGMISEADRQLTAQARALGGDPWPETLERLRVEHGSPETLVDIYRDAVERSRTHVLERELATVPDGPLEVIETPRFARAWVPVAGYLPPGPYSADRTGRLFVTVPGSGGIPGGHGRHAIPAAAAHEGFPGHHLQFGVAQSQDRSVRRLLAFPVAVEGWALYTEELMHETGFYRTPAERFLQLHALLWRAVRIPLDVGIHTGALSFDEAVRLLRERAKATRQHAEAEVRRVCAMPGYPSSYAVGRRDLLDLRARYRRAVGDAYTHRGFHDAVLAYGGLPQSLVRWGMERDA